MINSIGHRAKSTVQRAKLPAGGRGEPRKKEYR